MIPIFQTGRLEVLERLGRLFKIIRGKSRI